MNYPIDLEELAKFFQRYYTVRRLAVPDVVEAMMWCATELGEANEQLLARDPKWVRNNPKKHEPFSRAKFAEECGDIIMMAYIAAMAVGEDPLQILFEKLNSKMVEK